MNLYDRDVIDEISDNVYTRLNNKGLTPVEAQRLIKDVINIIDEGNIFTADTVKKRLKQLHWEGNIIDDHIFEQIVFMHESGEFRGKF